MQSHFERQKALEVIHISSGTAEQLTKLVSKNMDIQVSIQDGEVFVSSELGEVTFTPEKRFPA